MKPISLLELNRLIRQTLDLELEPAYWIVAEIGELRINQRGHCYMELIEKENDSIIAKIRANIWASNFRNINGWFESITGQPLKAGLNILAQVSVNFHEVYGMSLTVKDIDPKYTLGERARKRQEIIDQLLADGVFDMNRELTLPLVTQRIAVISSSTAAGFGDFVDQIRSNERGYNFEMELFPALMQGDKASESIIEAMHQVFEKLEHFDVLVIIRGGGAQVDLDCFDTYDLASHLAQFPIPVLTGIGHERDETICDLVAHTRLKTPTAVAAFLIHQSAVFEDRLDELYSRIWHTSSHFMQHQHQLIENIRTQIKLGVSKFLSKQNLKVNQLGFDVKHGSSDVLQKKKLKISELSAKLKFKPYALVNRQSDRISFLEKTIELLDPKTILNRGYSITTIDGKLLSNEKGIKKGMTITTLTRNQKIESSITEIRELNDKIEGN